MFSCPHRPLHRLSVAVAGLFGLATMVAGGSILLGFRDAGYAVVQPVLVFNTLMGVAYVATAALVARNLERGRLAAVAVAVVNVAVLALIVARRATGGLVADETVAAMALRVVVWAAIVLVLTYEKRAFTAARSS